MSTTTELHHVGTGQARRRRRRGIAVAGLVSVLAFGALALWNTNSEEDGHRLLYTETLPDGRVFRCYTDGAAIGSAGTDVSAGEAPTAPNGSEGGPAIVVRPPDLDEEEARRAAEEYRKSGRTFEQDQADFDRLSADCRQRR